MTSTAQLGASLEREIKNLFEDNGWSVMRGAGSKGNVFNEKADLIATRSGTKYKDDVHMIIIQCKKKKK